MHSTIVNGRPRIDGRQRSSFCCLLLTGLIATFTVYSDFAKAAEAEFPPELTRFRPVAENPVFEAAGESHWDTRIRERGWIVPVDDGYRLYYTGYDGTREGVKHLGLATSKDGIHWKRSPNNPIYSDGWVEDMMIVVRDGAWYMFAEGSGDQAQLLTSRDGLTWKRVGALDVRLKNGKPIPAGPYGTPAALFHEGKWYLFYERRDAGIWLATSTDMKVWTNISDQPVMKPGPDQFDQLMIALNQVFPYKGRFYAVIHGSGTPEKPRLWSTGIAVSDDLVHWKKYSGNPLQPMTENKSSGQILRDGNRFRFYTHHDRVDLHFGPKAETTK